jgi:hypothetical protein
MYLICGLIFLCIFPCALTTTTTVIGDATGTQAYRIADMMERFGANIFPSDSADHNYLGAYPSDFTSSSVIAAISWLTGDSGLTMRLRIYYAAGSFFFLLSSFFFFLSYFFFLLYYAAGISYSVFFSSFFPPLSLLLSVG